MYIYNIYIVELYALLCVNVSVFVVCNVQYPIYKYSVLKGEYGVTEKKKKHSCEASRRKKSISP